MAKLAILGCTGAGCFIGGALGFWAGLREGGDYNFAPAIYAPFAALVGGGVGVLVGVLVFA